MTTSLHRAELLQWVRTDLVTARAARLNGDPRWYPAIVLTLAGQHRREAAEARHAARLFQADRVSSWRATARRVR